MPVLRMHVASNGMMGVIAIVRVMAQIHGMNNGGKGITRWGRKKGDCLEHGRLLTHFEAGEVRAECCTLGYVRIVSARLKTPLRD